MATGEWGVDELRASLAELIAELRRASDVTSVLAAALRCLEPQTGARGGAIHQVNDDGLELVAAQPAATPAAAATDLARAAAASGDLTTETNLAAAPLVSLGRVCGVLVLDIGDEPLDARERTLVETVAFQVAAAMEATRRFLEVMELERLKRDFISRVSHELRTPMTIISGFLSTLLAHDERLGSEQRRHMVGRSLAASDRLNRLIEDLLVLSRLEAGLLTPDPMRVVVADVVEAVRAQSIAPDQVDVTVSDGLEATTDPVMFQRALGFVVDNALKYGEHADVRASRDAEGRVVVEVRDRGPGIPADVRPIVFEMFTRGADVTDVPGLGVGLPVARTLLEVLHGRLTIADEIDGQGALVVVSLPH